MCNKWRAYPIRVSKTPFSIFELKIVQTYRERTCSISGCIYTHVFNISAKNIEKIFFKKKTPEIEH